MLFGDAQSDFLTITLPTIIVTGIGGVGMIFLAAIAMAKKVVRAFGELKTELHTNTVATLAVLPAVAEKVDSGTREQEQLKEDAKKTVVNAAVQAVAVIGEQLRGQAKEAAVVVAGVAKEAHQELTAQVEKVEHAIKGPDGTCITGRLSKLEERMGSVETTMTEFRAETGEMKEMLKALLNRH